MKAIMKMGIGSIIMLISLAVLLLYPKTVGATPGSVQLTSADILGDTQVDEGNPDIVYGTGNSLFVIGTEYQNHETLIKWNISSIPQDAIIDEAILNLYAAVESSIGTYTCADHTLSCPAWEETAATWNNAPSASGDATDSVAAPGSSQWVSWVVTDIIQQCVNSGGNQVYPNCTIILKASLETDVMEARSKEYGSNTPTLDIDYYVYNLNITDPTTSSPNSVNGGDNITITFLYRDDTPSNITSGVTMENVLIGGSPATILERDVDVGTWYIRTDDDGASDASGYDWVFFGAMPNTNYAALANPLTDDDTVYSLKINDRDTNAIEWWLEDDAGGNEAANFMWGAIEHGHTTFNSKHVECGSESGVASYTWLVTFDTAFPSTSYSAICNPLTDSDSPLCIVKDSTNPKTTTGLGFYTNDDGGGNELVSGVDWCVFQHGEYDIGEVTVKAGSVSVTDGAMSVTFDTAFPDTNYVVFTMDATNYPADGCSCHVTERLVGSFAATCQSDNGLPDICGDWGDYDWVAIEKGDFDSSLIETEDQLAWVEGTGWQVNVTVPTDSFTGKQDLFLNATWSAYTRNDTQIQAISFSPIINIQSPTNTTYSTASVWANVTLDVAGSWCGRSVNGTANVTLTNSTGKWHNQMTGLPDNTHYVTFCCNDTRGTMNCSAQEWFTVDTTVPNIIVDNPDNTTYNSLPVDINLTLNESAVWCGWNLNGTANSSATGSETDWDAQIDSMAEGTSQLYVYCNDSVGNMGLNSTVWFTYDATSPTYSLNSTNSTWGGWGVEHRMYWEDETQLSAAILSFDNCTGTFANVSEMSLSGTSDWSNFTVGTNNTANCTIRWCVYANDTAGNWNDSCGDPSDYTIISTVSDCKTINTEGNYIQTQDIDFTGVGNCIFLDAVDNVVYDGNGYYIRGDNAGGDCIYVSSGGLNENIIIQNANVSTCDKNIYLFGSFFMGYGLKNIIVRNTTSTSGSAGIWLTLTNNSFIYNNTIKNCVAGIQFSSACCAFNNTFYDNKMAGSTNQIYFTATAWNNTLYNNFFNGSITIVSPPPFQEWNTTKQSGTRIYSPGNKIGGNYWTNSTGNDYSDTCTDSDTDGFCDDVYDVYNDSTCTVGVDCSNNVDYLPLSDKYSVDTCTPIPGENWLVNCAHNCEKSDGAVTVAKFVLYGSGTFTINNYNITADNFTWDKNCIFKGIKTSRFIPVHK